MRPLRLRVERFLGLERAELEFASDLFVIVGPNGAGKSSLLEAMYFALYGRGIRSERGKKELIYRGSPDKALRVQLEFLLGEKRFRVTREYSAKQGGVAYLEQYEGERWKPVASGEQGVNQHIEELLGCDALTFRSSVFLPQGETLAFVEASSADRFKILSSLFGLDILDRIREQVRGKMKTLEGELGSHQERLRLLEAEDLLGEEVRLREEVRNIEQELESARSRRQNLQGCLEKMRRLGEILWKLRENEEQLSVLRKRCEEVRPKIQEDDDIELAHRLCEAFERPWRAKAELLERVNQEVARTGEDLRKTEEDLLSAKKSLEELLREERRSLEEKKKLEHLVREVEERGQPLFEDIRRRREECVFWEREGQKLKTRIQELVREREDLLRERERKVAALEEREACLARVESAWGRIEEATRVLDALIPEAQEKHQELKQAEGERRRIEGELARQKEKLLGLLKEKETLEASLRELEAQRKDPEAKYRLGVKAFVVGELEEEWRRHGVCPVCGSAVPFPEGERVRVDILELEEEYREFHGHLARLASQREHLLRRIAELREEEEKALRDLEEVGKRKEILGRELQELHQRIRESLERCGYPEQDVLNLSRFREWVRSQGKAREVLQREVEAFRKDLVALEGRIVALEERLQEETQRLESITATLEVLQAELERQRALLGEYCALWGVTESGIPEEAFFAFAEDLKRRLQRAGQEVVRFGAEIRAKREQITLLEGDGNRLKERLSELLQDQRSLSQEEERLRQAFLEELKKRGWDETTYCRLRDKERGNWREVLHRLEGELEGLERRIAEQRKEKEQLFAELGLAADELEETFARWQKEAQDLEERVSFLHKRLGEVRERLRQNEEKQREWKELRETVGQRMKEYRVHVDLQQALEVGGFKNYLLRLFFARLEEEGSRILRKLSGERYALRMQMRRGMADLAVLDRKFGGGERLPEECSGGEKTLIALALALALSSLKLEKSYARRTECLFIDEGFSSLDREHLDLVADAIFRLSREGKMVGVVTHDPDFAGYFPVQLEVREGAVRWKKTESIVT